MFKIAVVTLLALATGALAQVSVDLRIDRRSYMAYEPVIATVSITNLAGRDILLQDTASERWLSFQIQGGGENLVAPRNADYHLSPLTVAAGESLKRQINLVALYPITDYGLYRIQATVYFVDSDKYYSSPSVPIEVSEGKLIWSQTVGQPADVDGQTGLRDLALMTFRRPTHNYLYAKVECREKGVVYAAHPLGRLVAGTKPQVLLDSFNQLNVMHVAAPKLFLHSVIGLDGEILSQETYYATNTRPEMRPSGAGQIAIFGGRKELRSEQNPSGGEVPKLSDRPVDLPK